MRSRRQRLRRGLDGCLDRRLPSPCFSAAIASVDLGLIVFRGDLIAVLAEVFSVYRSASRPGFGLRRSAAPLLIFFRMGLGVLHELIDFFFAESAGRRNLNGLFLLRRQIFGRDMDDAIRIDVERHFDLRHPAWRRRNADEIELPEELVIVRHFALALEDSNGHSGLIVGGGREYLALFCRDRGVALDQFREDSAESFDTQERVASRRASSTSFTSPFKHATLNRGADGHHFVRIDASVRFFSEEFFHGLNDFRHAGHAADEHDFLDIACRDAGVGQGLLAGFDRSLTEVVNQLFQFRAGQFHAPDVSARWRPR